MRFAWVPVAVAAALASGCLNDFEDPAEAHSLRITGMDVSAPTVSSGTVDLLVTVRLDNSGGKSLPIRLQTKAFDSETSLLVTTNATNVGRLEKDKTREVSLGLPVPRQSSYRLEALAYEADRIVQRAEVRLGNVGELERNLFDTGLKISEMDFLARNVSGGRVTIGAKIYVTNEADTDSRALRLQVKAREVSTGLLADEAFADVAGVGPEATQAANVTLDVPAGYNYAVDAVLWDGEFIVERGSGTVQLLPNLTKPKDEDLVVSTPDIQDFVGSQPGASSSRTPGPGLALLLVSIITTVGVLKWRQRT